MVRVVFTDFKISVLPIEPAARISVLHSIVFFLPSSIVLNNLISSLNGFDEAGVTAAGVTTPGSGQLDIKNWNRSIFHPFSLKNLLI